MRRLVRSLMTGAATLVATPAGAGRAQITRVRAASRKTKVLLTLLTALVLLAGQYTTQRVTSPPAQPPQFRLVTAVESGGVAVRPDGISGYSVDGYGNFRSFGNAPPLWTSWTPWGVDIVRGIALDGDGKGGQIVDGYGGLHAFGNAGTPNNSNNWGTWDIVRGVALDSDGLGGQMLDGFGGVHPFGNAAALSNGSYWNNWDIARGISLTDDGKGGQLLDGWGGVHPLGNAGTVQCNCYWSGWDIARGITLVHGSGSSTEGYVLDGWGGIHTLVGTNLNLQGPSHSGDDSARGISVAVCGAGNAGVCGADHIADINPEDTLIKDVTTTTMTSSSTVLNLGASVTFTATVTPSSASGTVSFYDHTTLLSSPSLTTTNGVATATYSTASLSWGSHSITAQYNGDTYDVPSSSGRTTVNVAAAPGAPTGLSVVAGNGQATVGWQAPVSSPAGNPIDSFGITPCLGTWSGTTCNGTSLPTLKVAGNLTSFVVPNLANGQTYSFSVDAINAAGTGPAANTTTVVPGLPGAPTAVSVTGTGNGTATVHWTAPSNAGAAAISGYTVTPSGLASTTFWSNATSETVSGLTDGSAYTFSVAAVNPYGTGPSATSGSGTPAATAPGAPTGLQVTPGDAQATVTWVAPTSTGGSAITGYTITPYIAGTAQTPTSATASPATVTGLTDGTTYTFTVSAVNAVGSAASAQSWAMTPQATPVVPTIAMSLDKGANGIYGIGTVATYTATLSANGTVSSATFSDSLPAGITGPAGAIQVNGAACATPVVCTSTTSAITVTGLSLASGQNTTVTYSALVTGSARSCSALGDGAQITANGGNSAAASVNLVACDPGLGASPWMTYVDQSIGNGGSADVNVANGNLVVTATDAMPMQLHGQLGFALTRTFNSQNSETSSVASPFGPGWAFSFTSGGSDTAGMAILAPSYESLGTTTPIVLVDTSGARYLFTPSALSSVIDVDGLTSGSPLATAIPAQLLLDSGFNRRCIDESYQAPAGIHVSMWRYIETSASNCSNLGQGSTTAVLGYVTLGADRFRREFSATGQLRDIRDPAGNEVDYSYTGSNLTAVTEAGSGRHFSLSYGSGSVAITDPGGEITNYATNAAGQITSVTNADGTTLAYAYGTCTGAWSYQLCSAQDQNGHATTFTYSAAVSGPPAVASVTDRDGHATTLAYNSDGTINADRSGERRHFAGIDGAGRVGEVDEGSTASVWLHQTYYLWDTASAGCRQPDAAVDNNDCGIIRRALGGNADRVTYYTYSDEGRMLSQRDLNWPADSDTTVGYQAQYFEAGGTVSTYTDSVGGSNTVTSTNQTGGRHDAGTLFAIVTQTQSLTARGNAAGSGYATYLTTWLSDTNSAVSPNRTAGVNICTTPGTPSANTGLLCETDGPSFDGGTHPHTITRYTYDTLGQRITMTTPKAIAEGISGSCNGQANQTPACYTYTYYSDADHDLSGTTVAGGWMKGTTDPTGNFVASAYDAEGHQVRSWDRKATAGTTLASYPGTFANTAQVNFTETLYTVGFDTDTSTFSAPGRYVVAARTANATSNEWTTLSLDHNGNIIGSDSPRGGFMWGGCPQVTTMQTFITCHTYDNNDQLLSVVTPMDGYPANFGSVKATSYTYDTFGNKTMVQDPDGKDTLFTYDTVNRLTSTTTGRWPSSGGANPTPAGCTTSSASPWITTEVICTTSTGYDGVDNAVSQTDANGHIGVLLFDAVHHQTEAITPRQAGGLTNVASVSLYDADGHLTDSCSAREMTEGGYDNYACTSTSAFGTHKTYDAMGRVTAITTYRGAAGPQTTDTTTTGYDADGNAVSVTDPNQHTTTSVYGPLDRLTSTSVPRDANSADNAVTTYSYDGAGDRTGVTQPNGQQTDYSYDADHRLVDTVVGASSADITQTGAYNGSTGTNVRTRNVYDLDGHVIATYGPNAFATSTTPNPLYMAASVFNADGEVSAEYQGRYDTSSLTDPIPSNQTLIQEQECPTGASAPTAWTSYAESGATWFAGTTGVCTTAYSYDSAGHQSTVGWPTAYGSDRPTTTYSYTDDGLLWSESDPSPMTNGQSVTSATYQYDGDGKQTKVTDANGLYTQTAYTADELAATTTKTPKGTITHVTSYGYDASGDQTSVTDAVGNVSTKAYNSDGTALSSTDGAGDLTTYAYDAAGNPTQVMSPSANALDATNPSGLPTLNFYTYDNLLAATVTPITGASSERAHCYYYDASGRKAGEYYQTTTNGGNNCPATLPQTGGYAFAYQSDNRLASETGTANGNSGGSPSSLTYTYDASGNQTLANGQNTTAITSTYYADNSVRTVDDGRGRTAKYAYDGAGQLTARNSDSSSNSYWNAVGYNDADLPSAEASWINSGTSQTTWTYDAGGRMTQQHDGNGVNESWSYAPDGTVSLSDQNTNGSPVQTWFDGDFRLIQIQCTCGGAGGGAGPGRYWGYQYDAAGRLSGIQNTGTNGTWNTNSYDHDGNRTQHTDVKGNTTYFTYNADDSISTSTLTGLYSYDISGQITGDGCSNWKFDGLDRVLSVQQDAHANSYCPAIPTESYSYDGRGRTASSTTGGTTTTLHPDGLHSQTVVETAGSTDTAYALTPSDTPTADIKNGTAEYLSVDATGSVVTTTNSLGGIQCQLDYDPYGALISPQSATNPCESGSTSEDMLYQAGRRDAGSGSYQLGTRSYDPTKNSFLQPDHFQTGQPAQDLALQTDPLTRNTYGYVNGDPVNLFDPSGHAAGCRFGTDCTDMTGDANYVQAVAAHGETTPTHAQQQRHAIAQASRGARRHTVTSDKPVAVAATLLSAGLPSDIGGSGLSKLGAPSEVRLGVAGSKANGLGRSINYGDQWDWGDLQDNIDLWAGPNAKPWQAQSAGKIGWGDPTTGAVVYDTNGNYFRIEVGSGHYSTSEYVGVAPDGTVNLLPNDVTFHAMTHLNNSGRAVVSFQAAEDEWQAQQTAGTISGGWRLEPSGKVETLGPGGAVLNEEGGSPAAGASGGGGLGSGPEDSNAGQRANVHDPEEGMWS